MVKSKFQVKAQQKVAEPKIGSATRYYDEDLPKKGNSQGIFVILLIMIILGAGSFGIYKIATKGGERGTPTTTTSNPTTTSTGGVGIKLGDTFTVHYRLWVADVPGEEGEVNTSGTPREEDDFTATTSNVIVGFRNNILGMTVGQEKTFSLDYDEGYTTGDLAYYKLVFYVKVLAINP